MNCTWTIIITKENSITYDEVTDEIAISSAIVQVLPLRYNLRQGTKERKATRMQKFQIRWRSVIRSSVRLQGDFRALQWASWRSVRYRDWNSLNSWVPERIEEVACNRISNSSDPRAGGWTLRLSLKIAASLQPTGSSCRGRNKVRWQHARILLAKKSLEAHYRPRHQIGEPQNTPCKKAKTQTLLSECVQRTRKTWKEVSSLELAALQQ